MGQNSSRKNYLDPTTGTTSDDRQQNSKSLKALHEGGILDVCAHNSLIVSCSDDKTISIFKSDVCLSNYSSIEKVTLQGHQRAVNKICCRGNNIISISIDIGK